jgi:Flp pilus assembly protein TadG
MALFAASGLRGRIRAFRRDTDGSILVFSLLLFTVMILMGGMAVDLMRVENRRTALSQTLDRCALNAASLRQSLDPATVVRDCAERDGMLPYLTSVVVTDTLGNRSVEARGQIPVETIFMRAAGYETLPVTARARAEHRVNNIEIVLALDVSASMNTNSRIQGLRVAAQNFVRTVLGNNPTGVSIAIVPYHAQVNLGPTLVNKYNVTDRIGGLGVTSFGDMRTVNCVDLPTSVYAYPGLSRTLAIPATGYADLQSSDQAWPTYETFSRRVFSGFAVCPPSTTSIVRPPDNNITALVNYIEQLQVYGQTSINLGMKWAGTLIDPQARSVINELVAEGVVPAAFRDRPAEYGTSNTMKIIVLMTDGENTTEARLNSGFRTGPSPIFRGTDGNLSIQHVTGRPAAAGANQFWVPHLDPDNNASNGIQGAWRATSWGGSETTQGTRLNWEQVWQITPVTWLARQLYGRALGTTSLEINNITTNWTNAMRTLRGTTTSTPGADAELQQLCTVTKERGVLIYGIAFSAPARGVTTIRNCASSEAFFFNATNNTSINAAFQSIATNITQLRLTN